MPETPLFNEIKSLETEQRNPVSSNIDIASTLEILEIINSEDKKVALAVEKVIPAIEIAVERIVAAFQEGGRLFYLGAGTSGRIGIVDAAECPPTFGTPAEMVQAIIAGGNEAVFAAQEGAEDSLEEGAEIFQKYGITNKDILCGIAASGRTPIVRGALDRAKELGVYTIFLSTISEKRIAELGISANCVIAPQVGAEVITGSTRMKSGTAQKLVLNMLTTTAMVKLGKTYSNVMIDLQMTNKKLIERAKRTLMEICEVDYDKATQTLDIANYNVKTAILMLLGNHSLDSAKILLEQNNGFVKKALQSPN